MFRRSTDNSINTGKKLAAAYSKGKVTVHKSTWIVLVSNAVNVLSKFGVVSEVIHRVRGEYEIWILRTFNLQRFYYLLHA